MLNAIKWEKSDHMKISYFHLRERQVIKEVQKLMLIILAVFPIIYLHQQIFEFLWKVLGWAPNLIIHTFIF